MIQKNVLHEIEGNVVLSDKARSIEKEERTSNEVNTSLDFNLLNKPVYVATR